MKKHLNYIVVFAPTSRGRIMIDRIVTDRELKSIDDSIRRNSITPVFSINYATGFNALTRSIARCSRRVKIVKKQTLTFD